MNWYALFVETGREELVQALIQKYLDETEIRAFVPKRKIKERRQGLYYDVFKILFPGYVLVQTNMNAEMYYKLKNIPKYYGIINKSKSSNGDEVSSEKTEKLRSDSVIGENENLSEKRDLFFGICEDEINLILKLMDNEDVIDYSMVYLVNSNVVVESGPLKGMEGIIKKIDKRKNRAKIKFDFMGNEKVIDVGIETLV